MDKKEFKKFVVKIKELAKSPIQNKKKITAKGIKKSLKGGISGARWCFMLVLLLSLSLFLMMMWFILLPLQVIVYMFNKKKFGETYPQKLITKLVDKIGIVEIDGDSLQRAPAKSRVKDNGNTKHRNK